MINLIAAISDNNAIGVANSMPWHISADLKFFKAKTMGNTVIMGRHTWESIGCKALPGRLNIVITSSQQSFEEAEKADSFESAIAIAKELKPESEIFIIGGGSLYRQAIGMSDRLYITHVHTIVDNADTFFPIIDHSVWKIIEQTPVQTDEKSGYNIQFVTYGKIN